MVAYESSARSSYRRRRSNSGATSVQAFTQRRPRASCSGVQSASAEGRVGMTPILTSLRYLRPRAIRPPSRQRRAASARPISLRTRHRSPAWLRVGRQPRLSRRLGSVGPAKLCEVNRGLAVAMRWGGLQALSEQTIASGRKPRLAGRHRVKRSPSATSSAKCIIGWAS